MIKYKSGLKSQKAFTLIELLIVISIIGILASIVYPSYQESIDKARRSDAKGALLGFANAMERHFTENNDYLGAAGTDGSPADTGAPRIYAIQSPMDGSAALYNLTINAAGETTYSLFAAPTGLQANDKCGTLTLNQTGAKGFTGTGMTVADCW